MFKNFTDGLNNISNTIWGIVILSVSISLGWTGKTELCYYFAGIGTTLLGIRHSSETEVK